jgi:hypothetical protein
VTKKSRARKFDAAQIARALGELSPPPTRKFDATKIVRKLNAKFDATKIVRKLNAKFDAAEPLFFWSGSQSPSRLQTLLEEGFAAGISISACPKDSPCYRWLCKNARDSRLRLFVDSGAYKEWSSPSAQVTDAEWRERYEQMATLAEKMGTRAWVVLPDKIQDSKESQRRIKLLGAYVRRIVRAGSHALLPLQKAPGERIDASAYVQRAARSAGIKPEQITPAIPMPAKSYSDDEIIEVVRALSPKAIHLLGVSADTSAELVGRIQRACPGIRVTLDSVKWKRAVGMKGGFLRGPKPLTRYRYEAALQIDPQLLLRDGEDGRPRLDVLVRVLSGKSRGNLTEAAKKLADIVFDAEAEYGLPEEHRPALLREASAFLRGQLYPVSRDRSWRASRPARWTRPQGSVRAWPPPDDPIWEYPHPAYQGASRDWHYYVSRVAPLVFQQGAGRVERRSGTHAEAASTVGATRHLRGGRGVMDEVLGVALHRMTRRPGARKGPRWSISQVDETILPHAEKRQGLTRFGAGQIARWILYTGRGKRWLQEMCSSDTSFHWEMTPEELLRGVIMRAGEIHGTPWRWSSDSLERAAAQKGEDNPANDPRWFTEVMR